MYNNFRTRFHGFLYENVKIWNGPLMKNAKQANDVIGKIVMNTFISIENLCFLYLYHLSIQLHIF